MHQISHIQNRGAYLLDGFRYVARLEIHQRYPCIFNHRGADTVSGVVDLIWHAFISTRLEILRPCWRCLFSHFLFIAMSTPGNLAFSTSAVRSGSVQPVFCSCSQQLFAQEAHQRLRLLIPHYHFRLRPAEPFPSAHRWWVLLRWH